MPFFLWWWPCQWGWWHLVATIAIWNHCHPISELCCWIIAIWNHCHCKSGPLVVVLLLVLAVAVPLQHQCSSKTPPASPDRGSGCSTCWPLGFMFWTSRQQITGTRTNKLATLAQKSIAISNELQRLVCQPLPLYQQRISWFPAEVS